LTVQNSWSEIVVLAGLFAFCAARGPPATKRNKNVNEMAESARSAVPDIGRCNLLMDQPSCLDASLCQDAKKNMGGCAVTEFLPVEI